jgi:hypothetical protein
MFASELPSRSPADSPSMRKPGLPLMIVDSDLLDAVAWPNT